jgi:hypothetical protein
MSAIYKLPSDPAIHTSNGNDTWYRVKLRLPSCCFQPTTGQWNWLVEWHEQTPYGAASMGMGINTDYPVVTCGVGQNPRLAFRLSGGDSTNPTYKWVDLPPNSLMRDHWYDILFHINWSPDPNVGHVQWFVDGTKWIDQSFPTLYHNPDGTVDRPGYGLYDYHLATCSNERVDFDNAVIGPSLSSVGG